MVAWARHRLFSFLVGAPQVLPLSRANFSITDGVLERFADALILAGPRIAVRLSAVLASHRCHPLHILAYRVV